MALPFRPFRGSLGVSRDSVYGLVNRKPDTEYRAVSRSLGKAVTCGSVYTALSGACLEDGYSPP